MQTIIRVRLSEINASFLEKLRIALGQLADEQDPELDIVLKDAEYDPTFVEMIRKSSGELAEGKMHVFTLESLKDFARS